MIQTDIFKIMADEYLTGVTEPVVKKTMPQGLGARSSMSIKNDAAEANKIEPIKMGGAVDTIAKYYNKIIAEQIKDSRGNVSTDKGAEYTPVSYSAILDGAQDVSSAGYDFDKVLRDSARTGKLSSATPPRNLKSDILTKIEYNLSTEIEARNAKVAKKDGIPLMKPDFIDRLIDRVAKGFVGKPSEDDAADVSLIESEGDTSLLSKSPKDAKFLRGEGLDESLSDVPSKNSKKVLEENEVSSILEVLPDDIETAVKVSLRPKVRPKGLASRIDLGADAVSNISEDALDLKPRARPKDLTEAIFAAVTFSGSIRTPKEGEDPITWIAENVYGADETDPDFQKAMAGIGIKNIDTKTGGDPWCASFVAYVLENMGVDLTVPDDRIMKNKAGSYNYQFLGDRIYDYNPSTDTTYSGKKEDVKAGDLIIFNKKKDRLNTDGDFSYGLGHASFVVRVEDDGTIIAIGGNQKNKVQTSRYTPEAIKDLYPGGYKINRINTNALKETSPEVIAEITKGMVDAGDGI